MVVVHIPERRILATVGCTVLFNLFGFSSLVKAEIVSVDKHQFRQQENVLKCGYRRKEITLNLPSISSPEKIEQVGNRIEHELETRCIEYKPPIGLTALIPSSNIGITLAEYPTFLFYIPEANLEGVEGEFSLRNEKDEEVYQKIIKLKDSDNRIVRVELSGSGSAPLEVGKFYYWVFTILFDPIDRSANTDVSGWIKRVEPSSELKHKLINASPQEQPAIYATDGIWYEAVVSLANLRCSSPSDLSLVSDWESLLQQVGLPEVSNKPLAQCN